MNIYKNRPEYMSVPDDSYFYTKEVLACFVFTRRHARVVLEVFTEE